MVLVRDTLACSGLVGAILGRFPIMAMPVKQLEVHQPIVATKAARDDVIRLQHLSGFEVQPTERTPSLLKLQEIRGPGAREGVIFQPLCEVRAGCHRTGWPRL
jgi:hypothetical protein